MFCISNQCWEADDTVVWSRLPILHFPLYKILAEAIEMKLPFSILLFSFHQMLRITRKTSILLRDLLKSCDDDYNDNSDHYKAQFVYSLGFPLLQRDSIATVTPIKENI